MLLRSGHLHSNFLKEMTVAIPQNKILYCCPVLVLCFLTWSAVMRNKIYTLVTDLFSGFAFQSLRPIILTEFGNILFFSNHRGLSSVWLYSTHCTYWLFCRFSVLKIYWCFCLWINLLMWEVSLLYPTTWRFSGDVEVMHRAL